MDRVSLPEVSGLMRHLASSNRHNLLYNLFIWRKNDKMTVMNQTFCFTLLLSQDLDGVEEFIRENHEKLVAIGEVRECHMPSQIKPFLQ